MAQGAISDQINRHVEAVLALSKRDILWRLVNEAERCVELDQTSAALILAGIALEELSSLSDRSTIEPGRQNLEAWRELRDRASHPASGEYKVDSKAVAAMVTGIRAILDQIEGLRDRPPSFALSDTELTNIRGKYAFVATSVDDFLKRKREDLEPEDCR
jgi:hypothetical protein